MTTENLQDNTDADKHAYRMAQLLGLCRFMDEWQMTPADLMDLISDEARPELIVDPFFAGFYQGWLRE